MRAALNLTVAKKWSDITSNTIAAAALKALYKDIDTVDAVVGGLAEDVEAGNVIGPLYKSVLTLRAYTSISHIHLRPLHVLFKCLCALAVIMLQLTLQQLCSWCSIRAHST
jgi:Animal haem peroxidase